MTFKNSIQARLVRNFILIILISVLAFEVLLVYFTRLYFYNNIESILTNQIKTASDFYTRYFSDVPLEVNIMDNADLFWKQTTGQVQIVRNNGVVLLDSQGLESGEYVSGSDFKQAQQGKKGVWIGLNNGKEQVMIVAYPLKSDTEQVGVIRFITSLKDVDKIIFNISMIFIIIGIVVILVAGTISIVLANSIIHPLKNVTGAAELMAEGNLDVRLIKSRNDEIGKLSDTLNYMASEIQKRERIKNDFISTVSHELRTPLTSIKGWANTIIDDDYSDREILSDGLNIIVKESDRLTEMVEDLLDFSRFVSGNVELKKEKTDVCSIIDYIEKQMSGMAKKGKIIFSVKCEKVPTIVLDKNRITQLLINLLGNAFNFTPKNGMVALSSFLENDNIVFRVEDTGCGISPEELPLVTEKFYKGKSSNSHTGLGLSICDEIVKLHNGSLEIESELDKGTIVTVRIPYGG
ncbi:sensor histidine kinase [Ruminiclostridium cellulolyticum]|uniref:histidine kinase n=1 Tax=Ruminiclostridium cellulolyticum (strain ATCC 35319 / DSM 5812 / JCM 6584 / H10) TaxID=394503 RepID=B8I4T6_RUMCH|nr:HAMP domain-containing sensor histidine kinase [Ruminiclostridium cellulolyticum]ACL76590.1 histidine kinase [Ruminiclostridium cellulolyticum H10]